MASRTAWCATWTSTCRRASRWTHATVYASKGSSTRLSVTSKTSRTARSVSSRAEYCPSSGSKSLAPKTPPTAEWLGRFKTDLQAQGFSDEFIHDALLMALDTELKTDGLIVTPEVADG